MCLRSCCPCPAHDQRLCAVVSAELVARLQKENEELRGQVDCGTLAKVQDLQNDLDDSNRLRESFEQRFRKQAAKSEQLLTALTAAQGRIARLEPQLEEQSACVGALLLCALLPAPR